MNTYLSPEITVLLMACTLYSNEEKKTELSQFLAKNSIDWNLLDALADRHRLKPFLYHSLQKISSIPHAFQTSWQNDCREAATDNLLKLHHYHSLRKLLSENGIDHIPLKGIYLAENYYPDSSLRSTGDIDILIHTKDVFSAIQLLRQHAYQLSQRHALYWKQEKQILLKDLFEVSLYKSFLGNSLFEIDLHWQMLGFNKHYAQFDLNYFRTTSDFYLERQVVLLVAHHGVTNIWQKIYYINDLYFLLAGKDISWPWLLDELRQYKFEDVFLAGLYWCQKIWNLPLPAFIEALVNKTDVEQVATEYAANWARKESFELSDLIVRQLNHLSKTQPHFRNKLKVYRTFLTSRIFQPSVFKFGKSYIYLPQEAGFITIFIRAMRSVWKFLPAKSVVVSGESKTGEDQDLARNESSQSPR